MSKFGKMFGWGKRGLIRLAAPAILRGIGSAGFAAGAMAAMASQTVHAQGGMGVPVFHAHYDAMAFAGDNEANREAGYTKFNVYDDAGNLLVRGEPLWREQTVNRVVTTGLNILLDYTFKTGSGGTPAWYIGICAASINDGAITSGAAVLTSASNPFASTDAGRAIIVRGAGASGADLVTTILTYTNAGSVTLNTNASATVTGAAVIWEARAADTMSSHSPWTESTAYSNANRPAFTPGTISAGSVDNSASQASFNINVNNTIIGGLFLVNNNTVGGTTGTLYGQAPFSVSFRQLNNGDTLAVTATLTQAST